MIGSVMSVERRLQNQSVCRLRRGATEMSVSASLPDFPVDSPVRGNRLTRSIKVALAIYLMPVVLLVCLIGLASIVVLNLFQLLATVGQIGGRSTRRSIGPSSSPRIFPTNGSVLRESRVKS